MAKTKKLHVHKWRIYIEANSDNWCGNDEYQPIYFAVAQCSSCGVQLEQQDIESILNIVETEKHDET